MNYQSITHENETSKPIFLIIEEDFSFKNKRAEPIRIKLLRRNFQVVRLLIILVQRKICEYCCHRSNIIAENVSK
jgi:hypothetical protein